MTGSNRTVESACRFTGLFLYGYATPTGSFLYSILAVIISIFFISSYAKKLRETSGKQIPLFFISLGLLIVLPALSFLIGGVSLDFEIVFKEKLETMIVLLISLAFKNGIYYIKNIIYLTFIFGFLISNDKK